MPEKPLKPDVLKRQVMLSGIADIMFDRFVSKDANLRPEEKMYFDSDGKSLVIPAANISSFLSAENTPSAPKRFFDSRKYKAVAYAIKSYTSISPLLIPLTRNGKQIEFGGFEADVDPATGIYIHRAVARLANGIPNEKVRPVVPTPWQVSFELTLFANEEVNEGIIYNLFVRGGMAIGLGSYRGVFGKFAVTEWA